MSPIELPPQSLKRFLADEGGYSLNRTSDGKEHSRVSEAYDFVSTLTDPFMGDWVDGMKISQYGITFEQNRLAFSGPVSIEENTWIFVVQENLKSIAGSKFSTFQIGVFDGKSRESQTGLYVVTPGVVRAKGIELKTSDEFDQFHKALKFIGQHLIKPRRFSETQ